MARIPMAREIMCSLPQSVHPETSILHAVQVLHKKSLSCIPVVDNENHLVGILTEKDCLRILSCDVYEDFELSVGGRVGDYMSKVSTTLAPQMDIFACAAKFLQTNFRCLPVLDGQRVIGYVSRQHMLSAILEVECHNEKDRVHELAVQRTVDHPGSIPDYLTLTCSCSREQLGSVFSKRQAE